MKEENQTKKICFFSGDITRSGGTERVASMIANELVEREGFQIVFLSIVEQQEEMFFPLSDRISRYVLDERKTWIAPGPGYLPLIPRLRKFLKEQEISCIVDIDTILDILTVPAKRGLPVTLIAWEHFNYGYQWPSERYRKFRKKICGYTARHADEIVTLTERDMENYKKCLGRKDRIQTIYNPVKRKQPDTKNVPNREKMLITVGRLTQIKGIDYLCKIAPDILKKYPDWSWYVLGAGEDRPLLEDTIRKEQLQDQLILTGNVPDVEGYLQRASIYVMTSRSEGLPMCLLEAMEQGVGCISFDIPTGPAEIIMEGKNGYLITPFDLEQMKEKISILIENEELRKHFSEQTSETVQRFDMNVILQKWTKLLKRCC